MTGSPLVDFFLALAVALGGAKAFGALARRVGQPAVVGEITVGLLIGPMALSGMTDGALLPASAQPLLTALADVGLALFMLVIGYEMDASFLRGRGRAAGGLAAGSVLVPLAGGVALAVPLSGTYAGGERLPFVLFVGVALSVTAFPVLARILADRGLNRHPVGGMSLAAAAVGDLVAWLLLAGITAYAGAAGQWRMALLPVYLVLMACVVRPLLARALARAERRGIPAPRLLPALVAGLMLSCAATEWLGVHFIFGAFAFGAVMPRSLGPTLRTGLIENIELAGCLLLPLYFVLAGTKVDVSGFGPAALGALAAVLAVAVLTKAGGAYAGARLAGVGHGEALPAAVLMNTRGLTEIVIVAVGLELGLITEDLYSIMIVMAVLTTAMTGPLLRLTGFGPGDAATAGKAATPSPDGPRPAADGPRPAAAPALRAPAGERPEPAKTA
ncbi:cation:proton antiporter [Streptomyces sp. TRM 70351]|uniref:cation:proton antiporter n=1 Tax=Streptomyces sp. TRM 70351 TaxID=3116552 RepID=UPI002E7AEC94|nr:cation:proton antiporter [Streptomyces sp. TRM 70351]MEE1927334.1 cation:proton antiporter [Streptomyces sp. TRM 70351]